MKVVDIDSLLISGVDRFHSFLNQRFEHFSVSVNSVNFIVEFL